MSSLTRDYGSEINELLASLGRITVPAHANADWTKIRNLQRRLNGKTVLMQTVARRRAALVEDRRWAESDIHGFERALVLVGGAGDTNGTISGGARLQQRLDARVSCVDELTIEIEAIDGRIRQIETEIVSSQQVLVVVLGQSIDNAEEKIRAAKQARQQRKTQFRASIAGFDETPLWSPSAVMGYRIWEFRKGGMYGAWEKWETPHLDAVCEVDGDLPHTDGRCAEVAYGCGIYATKTPERLMGLVSSGKQERVAVGLVGLEGRVIEHETGYRAERATILALAVVDRGRIRTIEDASELEHLLTAPVALPPPGARWLPVATTTRALRANVIDYLKNQAQRRATWTSANPNE